MALIHCPECGNEISSDAKTCPHCGCRITICPDCNAVYTQNPEICTNCGHVFNNSPNAEEQNTQDDFKIYVKNKLSLTKVLQYLNIVLRLLVVVCILVPFIMLWRLTKNDPIAYLAALSIAEIVSHVLIILSCVIMCISLFIENVFLASFNILHKFAAKELTLNEINGVQYCKEHQNSLNNVDKKANEWKFALNAAYRQDDNSSGKYDILIFVFGLIFSIIGYMCFTISVYQIFDNFEADLLNNLTYYIVLLIGLAFFWVSKIFVNVIQKKYIESLKKWGSSKSLPINFK